MKLADRLSREAEKYEHGHDQPLRGYGVAMAVYAGGVAVATALGRATGRRPPRRFRTSDIVLGGLATHKFARIIAKDVVVSPVRLPFTRLEESAGAGEVNETVRSEEVGETRQGIGELISCPFCLAPWIAGGYVAALVFVPRAARSWAAAMSTVGISDVLQHVYARIRTG